MRPGRPIAPLRFCLALALCLPGTAGASGPFPEISGEYVIAAESRGQAAATFLFKPVPDRGLLLGPRISWMYGGIDGGLGLGAGGALWILNAIGPGAAIEVFRSGGQWVLRIEPSVTLRLARSGEDSAWALRLGAAYDRRFRWGTLLGVSFQLSGA